MKKSKLGRAFHETLEFLETIEVIHDKPDHVLEKMKIPQLAIEDSYFRDKGDRQARFKGMSELVSGYAELAGELRSSVKYKMTAQTVNKIIKNYQPELEYIGNNYPLKLPHEYTTLILESETEHFVIIASERKMPEGGYSALGLEAGDSMINLCMIGWFPNGVRYEDTRLGEQKLSHFPLEIHLTDAAKRGEQYMVPAPVSGIEMTDAGIELIQNVVMIFNIFLASFDLTSVLREKRPGVPPMKNIERRHKKRKKHQHPQFEHTIIKFEVDAPEDGQAGYSILQSKKRLHQVRGFWRHYKKTGKRVWVKGHWRGDEKLGVIRRDVELVTHEEEETA